jgi:hypothetical protein
MSHINVLHIVIVLKLAINEPAKLNMPIVKSSARVIRKQSLSISIIIFIPPEDVCYVIDLFF